MNQIIIIFSALLSVLHLNAQTGFIAPPPETTTFEGNSSCAAAFPVCENLTQNFQFTPISETNCDSNNALFFVFNFAGSINNGIQAQLNGGTGIWEWYGPFEAYNLGVCEQMNNYNTSFQSGAMGGTNGSPLFSSTTAGFYILKIKNLPCNGSIHINVLKARLNCKDKVLCTECVTSFSPSPGRYIVSAWVKEKTNSHTITNYQNSAMQISFTGSGISYFLNPSGSIIDGWQRIEKTIDIPIGSTGINIELTTSAQEAFFDDIRFFPYDGSMMSYVYDPVSLRLMAELDERNYATLYEYDEEGKLIRVKKETEKGIMTIQENRDNIKKGQ